MLKQESINDDPRKVFVNEIIDIIVKRYNSEDNFQYYLIIFTFTGHHRPESQLAHRGVRSEIHQRRSDPSK